MILSKTTFLQPICQKLEKRQYNTMQLYFTTLATHNKSWFTRWGVGKHVTIKYIYIQSKTFVFCSGSIIKVKKSSTNSEPKVKNYEIFRPFFNRTSSVNDMNVKKMIFKKGFLTPLGGYNCVIDSC